MPDDGPARLHYFRGRGRAETTRWMLAATGVAFVNVPLATAEEFAALKASGMPPFGQLPVLEIDGLRLSQSTAMIRYLARRGGLYGETPAEMLWCDMVAGAASDFAETALQIPFQPSHAVAVAALERAVAKFCPYFERVLTTNGGRWMSGGELSFADVVLAEALSNYREAAPDILGGFPALTDLLDRVVETPGVAAYLISGERWRTPDADYVVDVARVLQRALPAHMPDRDRFVP